MDTWNAIWSNDIYRKLILSVLVLLAQAAIRRSLLSYVINRIPDDSPHLYTVRKATTYIITITTTLLLYRNLDTTVG